MLELQNKCYIMLYLISIGITITNIIQTGLALSTGMFIVLNPIGYNWLLFLLIIIFYLFMLTSLFIKDRGYKIIFLIGIIYTVLIGFGCFIHNFILILN